MKRSNLAVGECVFLTIFRIFLTTFYNYFLFSYFVRLTGTAWNLAQNDSKNIVGFSGTNDNHRILPLQVCQYFASKDRHPDPILKQLDGTNGKMLNIMMENVVSVRQLGTEAPPSDLLFNLIEEDSKDPMQVIHALIDCGALLAGIDLHDFSKRILDIAPVENFGGVLFFDATLREWVILERSGRLLQKDTSPVNESETFAIFDEPRCRGTDLKLSPEARALLTLAPKLCKDKLMQAAGRLRKLGRNQTLAIVGGPDVCSKIKDLGDIICSSSARKRRYHFDATVVQVLSWAMKNTVEATSAGLFNWADQGLFFSSTFGKDPKLCITEEVLKLNEMYGSSFSGKTLSALTCDARQYHLNRTGGERALDREMKNIVDSIEMRVNKYGLDTANTTSRCDVRNAMGGFYHGPCLSKPT